MAILPGYCIINRRNFRLLFKKYKTFFRIDIQLYQHEWKLEKREIVWKHDARRAECFHTISSFSNFHEFSPATRVSIAKTVVIESSI